MLTIGATFTSAVFVIRKTAYRICDYYTSTVEVRSNDPTFDYLMYWMSEQKQYIYSTSFVASAATNMWDNMLNPGRVKRTGIKIEEDNEEDIALAANDFNTYWSQRIRHDKTRPIKYTPCEGVHLLRYDGTMISFKRRSNQVSRQGRHDGPSSRQSEFVSLTCLGRSTATLRKLLAEAQKSYVERDGAKTVIYHGNRGMWQRRASRIARDISTVVLDPVQKAALVEDIREYLHPLTKRWYRERGIPYRRGYVLFGAPGTGKTSLCLALAGLFSLPVYISTLNEPGLSQETLSQLFTTLPTRSILLLEDVDAAGLTHKRSEKISSRRYSEGIPVSQSDDGGDDDDEGEEEGEDELGSTPRRSKSTRSPRISLSALLNAIDGIISVEGRILIMTTNHIDHLDSALLRPGRIDMSIYFENITTETAEELYRSFYSTQSIDSSSPQPVQDYQKRKLSSCDYPTSEEQLNSLATVFASRIPSGEISPAEMQGYLLTHKYRPDKAIANIQDWIVRFRYEKEMRKGPTREHIPATAAADEEDTRSTARARSKSMRGRKRRGG